MQNILRFSNRSFFRPITKFFYTPNSFISTLKDNIFTISLIGKPNVGKSSLFNKLTGGLNAITDSLPGLTRDRNEIVTKLWGGFPMRLVDTAGWETLTKKELNENEIKKKMIDQTAQALIYSDLGYYLFIYFFKIIFFISLALFIIDVKEGITATDFFLAQWLRKRHMEKIRPDALKKLHDDNEITIRKILLVANKCEHDRDGDIYSEVYKLGFGDPIFVSAEHGDGLQDLLQAIENEIPESKRVEYQERIEHRKEKFLQLKEKLKNEILDVQKENKENPKEGFLLVYFR